MNKIELTPKAQAHLENSLSVEVVTIVLDVAWKATVTKQDRIKAVDKILSNPHIYGMVLIDWMNSVDKVKDTTDELKKFVEAFANKEFES